MGINFDDLNVPPTVFMPDSEIAGKLYELCKNACGEWKTVKVKTSGDFLAEIKKMVHNLCDYTISQLPGMTHDCFCNLRNAIDALLGAAEDITYSEINSDTEEK